MYFISIGLDAVVKDFGIKDYNPSFIELALSAMCLLEQNNQPNIMQLAAYVLGSFHPGTEETRMPMNRMPFPAIAYQFMFFGTDHINEVTEENSLAPTSVFTTY
jgi:hypothetical protein